MGISRATDTRGTTARGPARRRRARPNAKPRSGRTLRGLRGIIRSTPITPLVDALRDRAPIPDGRRTRERRRYLTVPAYAARLAVHENTVRKWIRAGVLPAYRFEGEWRIRISDAARFEEQARFTVPADPPVSATIRPTPETARHFGVTRSREVTHLPSQQRAVG